MDIAELFMKKFSRKIASKGIRNFRLRNNIKSPDFHYTDNMIKFVRKRLIAGKQVTQITKEFNKYFKLKKDVNCIYELIRRQGINPKIKNIHKYTKEQIDFLKNNAENTLYKDLTQKFNETFGTNQSTQKIKVACRHRKIFNKMLGKAPGPLKSADGVTKKWGDLTFIKINGQWILKQRYVYENNFGKIPDGCNIVFIDHNPDNFDPDNLALVKRQQLPMLMKTKFSYSDKQTLTDQIALADLRLAIGKAERKLKNRKKGKSND